MIKIIFILLGWMTLGWFIIEKCCPFGYYDIFDEWAKEHDYTEKKGDALNHIEVQAVLYMVIPAVCIGWFIYDLMRKIFKSLYDKR